MLQDVDDQTLRDETIIEYLENLQLNRSFRSELRDIRNGPHDFTLLHSAAKQCRTRLCSILIDDYRFGLILLWHFYILRG
jgi:hypothetical protein